MRRMLIVIAILAAAGLVAGAAYLGLQSAQPAAVAQAPAPQTIPASRGSVEQSVAAPGVLECTHHANLTTATSGQIERIDVRPGDAVRAGQVLAQLEREPLEDTLADALTALERAEPEHAWQLAEARLNLTIAQANLAKAHANAPDDGVNDIAVGEHRLEQAKNTLWAAQAQRDSTCGQSHDAACDAAQASVQANEEAVRIAEIDLQQTRESAHTEAAVHAETLVALEAQVQLAEIAVDRLLAGVDPALQDAVEDARDALAGATLLAPFAGIVVDVAAEIGDSATPGQTILTLADTTVLEACTTVIEEDLPQIAVGQPVELFFDADPSLIVTGHVARIVPRRTDEGRAVYPVYIALDEPVPGMLPGMTVDGTITIAGAEDVLRLPRALVRAGAGDTARVSVWQSGEATEREITLGLRGDSYVEIVDGLDEGDEVVSR